MNSPNELVPRSARIYIYNVSLALIPILSMLGIINEEAVPLVISLLGAILALGVARTHVTPEELE